MKGNFSWDSEDKVNFSKLISFIDNKSQIFVEDSKLDLISISAPVTESSAIPACYLEINFEQIFSISSIFIVSSARSSEFYCNDEYFGSFRSQKNLFQDLFSIEISNIENKGVSKIKFKFFSLKERKLFNIKQIYILGEKNLSEINFNSSDTNSLGILKKPNNISNDLQSLLIQSLLNHSPQIQAISTSNTNSSSNSNNLVITEERVRQLINEAEQRLEEKINSKFEELKLYMIELIRNDTESK